ncbi:MAG: HIT family protein [Wenzhouxiangella sp.]
MTDFQIDPRLARDSLPVTELALCSVRLMNDRRFPWLLLIPRRAACSELLDLSCDDQTRLWQEIMAVSQALRDHLNPHKLNVAALGNQVAQLHVHVIGRYRNDAAWPAPVWGQGAPEPWGEAASALIAAIKTAL